jgi:hypothetical protein
MCCREQWRSTCMSRVWLRVELVQRVVGQSRRVVSHGPPERVRLKNGILIHDQPQFLSSLAHLVYAVRTSNWKWTTFLWYTSEYSYMDTAIIKYVSKHSYPFWTSKAFKGRLTMCVQHCLNATSIVSQIPYLRSYTDHYGGVNLFVGSNFISVKRIYRGVWLISSILLEQMLTIYSWSIVYYWW